MHQMTAMALCIVVFVCLVYGQHNAGSARSARKDPSPEDAFGDAARVLTTHGNVQGAGKKENVNSSSPFAIPDDVSGELLNLAVKEVAYYLRSHKFNEYDRRYEKKPPKLRGIYVESFPKPLLRSLHWEVCKYCENSFVDCITYLSKKIQDTALRRQDDTSVVIHEQLWSSETNSKQISTVEEDCLRLRNQEETLAEPFLGPLERFQWRTTASYFMCWYTMNHVEVLRHLGEPCDNFASCLDSQFGASNLDPRANDEEDFSCALYSFCPDPCCPIKHIADVESCWRSSKNPCKENPPESRQCFLRTSDNRNFRDLVSNRMNVSCNCGKNYVWKSRYGMCVDVNECYGQNHGCDTEREVCVNLPGSFQCSCNWGYVWSEKDARCVPSLALETIKRGPMNQTELSSRTKSLIAMIKSLFSLCTNVKPELNFVIAVVIFDRISIKFSGFAH